MGAPRSGRCDVFHSLDVRKISLRGTPAAFIPARTSSWFWLFHPSGSGSSPEETRLEPHVLDLGEVEMTACGDGVGQRVSEGDRTSSPGAEGVGASRPEEEERGRDVPVTSLERLLDTDLDLVRGRLPSAVADQVELVAGVERDRGNHCFGLSDGGRREGGEVRCRKARGVRPNPRGRPRPLRPGCRRRLVSARWRHRHRHLRSVAHRSCTPTWTLSSSVHAA